MRTSNYVIYLHLPQKQEYYLLHGYTGAVDKVQPSVVKLLLDRKADAPDVCVKDEEVVRATLNGNADEPIEEETWNQLIARGYLTEKTVEEEREYVKHIARHFHELAVAGSRPGCMIIPTYECNMRCPYCYESSTRKELGREHALGTVMSTEMADAVFITMDRLFEKCVDATHTLEAMKSRINITFFGGEPLMVETRPVVEYIMKKGRDQGYHFKAITNAVELDHFAGLLGPEGIDWLQVTLDGPREVHNRQRRGPRFPKGTYDTILNNVTIAIERGATVSLRLHVDWEAVGQVDEVMKDIDDRQLLATDKCNIYATPRHAWHKSQELPVYPNMSLDEVRRTMAQRDCGETGRRLWVPNEKLPQKLKGYVAKGLGGIIRTVEYCGSNTGNSHIFDPFGAIYSCWDTVGSRDEQIGQYSAAGAVYNERATAWKQRCPAEIPKCADCKYIMFHFGGCAGQAATLGQGLQSPACYRYEDTFIGVARQFFQSGQAAIAPSPASDPAVAVSA